MSVLEELGWTATLEAQFEQHIEDHLVPGRISAEHRGHFDLLTAAGEVRAQISGRMRHIAVSRDELPAVGDWVAAQANAENGNATIHAILPRRTALLRKDPDGRKDGSSIITAQVLAANLDTVFLVSALNLDFNLRRIERMLTVIWESGAQPVLLLNKADLCPDVEEHVAAAESVAVGVPIHALSALTGDGVGPIEEYVDHGKTVALIGSSGVGKSTLINHLAGEELMTVKAIRDDDSRGRHTTTHRQLVKLPRGGLFIDTPGLRQIGLWTGDEGIQSAFADVEALAEGCYFADCRHDAEPRCAIKAALESGELDPGRHRSYRKLQRELAHAARQQDFQARTAEKQRWKKISQAARRRPEKR